MAKTFIFLLHSLYFNGLLELLHQTFLSLVATVSIKKIATASVNLLSILKFNKTLFSFHLDFSSN